RALPSRVWLFGKARSDDVVQRRRRRRPARSDRWWVVRHDRRDQARMALAFKRFLAGAHLVDDAPKRPDIRSMVSLLPVELLGRHVLQRPENTALRSDWRRGLRECR